MVISHPDQFAPLREEILATGSMGIDTEFHSENRYFPDLYLVQISTETQAKCIDPLAGSIEYLGDLLANPKVVKILHAPQTDLKLLHHATGKYPVNIFDTQFAAAFLGLGSQLGYISLVEDCLKKKVLHQTATLSDWSRRPLGQNQLAYAVEDVKFLHPLYHHLHKKLVALDRLEWFEKSSAEKFGESFYQKNVLELYLKFKDGWRLSPPHQSILFQLICWRETVAARMNVPVKNVLQDHHVFEVAKLAPETLEKLEEIRSLNRSKIKNHGNGIVNAVKKGRASREPLPVIERKRISRGENSRLDLIKFFIKIRSNELNISPEFLLGLGDYETLLKQPPRTAEDLPFFKGVEEKTVNQFKRELFEFLTGKRLLGFDKNYRAALLPIQGDTSPT